MRNAPQIAPHLHTPGSVPGSRLLAFVQYRDLVRNLVAKDIKVRYMGAVLGFIWALVNPIIITLMYLFIFTVIFPSGALNFPLYLVTGMLHWMLFNNVVMQSSDLLVGNAGLIKKIYFPRILIPFANLLVNFVLWLFALAAYLLLFNILGGKFTIALLVYPLYFLLFAMFSFGISLVLSILYVHFRDIKHIVEIMMQVFFWTAPIVYAPTLIPGRLMPIYKANPLAEFTLIFADLWYYGRWPSLHLTLAFIGWTVVLLGIGLWLFRTWAHKLVEDL